MALFFLYKSISVFLTGNVQSGYYQVDLKHNKAKVRFSFSDIVSTGKNIFKKDTVFSYFVEMVNHS